MGMTEKDLEEMMQQDGYSEKTIRLSKLPLNPADTPAPSTAPRFDWKSVGMQAKAETAKPMEAFRRNPTRDRGDDFDR